MVCSDSPFLGERSLNALLVGSESSRGDVRSLLERAGFLLREQTDLPARRDDSELVCVVLDHPDQFAGEAVRRFLAEFAGARIVCVRSVWCASMLRSRNDWPAAVVVDSTTFGRRLDAEKQVIQGKRAPLPMTSGLEEIAEFGRTGAVGRVLFAVAMLTGLVVSGCQREAPKASAPKQASWTEQVEGVRRGDRKTIVVTAPPTAAEWALLGNECGRLETLEVADDVQADLTPEVFASLPKLKRLKLSGLTDEGAASLAKLPALSEVIVTSDSLTDAGVASLCQLPLVQLRLDTPRVTDAAMTPVGGLKQLRFLHLVDVPISDAALTELAKLESLESLYLDRAKCTDEGLSTLLKQRPDIHFHRDQTHLRDDPRKHEH